MKKLFIFIAGLVLTVQLSAQFVIFGNVPKDIFPVSADSDKAVNGVFLWSLDAVVQGFVVMKDDVLNDVIAKPMIGGGAAAGWKHYKVGPDGNPVSDWGINLALLTTVQINNELKSGFEIALLPSLYSLKAGPAYFFGENKFGLVVGADIKF